MKARFFEPMLCIPVPELPEGPEWQLELKLDGYRGIGIKTDGRSHLASRNGKNFSDRFSSVPRALDRLPDETVIDGEIVAVDDHGRPWFSLLRISAALTRSCSMYSTCFYWPARIYHDLPDETLAVAHRSFSHSSIASHNFDLD